MSICVLFLNLIFKWLVIYEVSPETVWCSDYKVWYNVSSSLSATVISTNTADGTAVTATTTYFSVSVYYIIGTRISSYYLFFYLLLQLLILQLPILLLKMLHFFSITTTSEVPVPLATISNYNCCIFYWNLSYCYTLLQTRLFLSTTIAPTTANIVGTTNRTTNINTIILVYSNLGAVHYLCKH